MPWFWQERSSNKGRSTETKIEETSISIYSSFTTPNVLIPTLILTTGLLTLRRVHHTYLRRVTNAQHLPPSFLRHRSVFGRVTSVGDADNFRLYHTPGGIFLGWGWLRHVPKSRKALTDQTLHIRIAGVDAPELPHFGKPGQKHGDEALAWLRGQLMFQEHPQKGEDPRLGRKVRCYVWSKDQYGRVVGTCWIRRASWVAGLPKAIGCWDLGERMLKAGWATVFEGKNVAEFGGKEARYRELEAQAKKKRVGMWGGSRVSGLGDILKSWLGLGSTESQKLESPREFKNRMKDS
ncbi:MAG: putative endonuclease lcl3 [Chrysothrix sp. TS-e1954]|nr:MAG: putative endonuclease lcl3 [Chrysothrix sp. TS-e1954]